MWSLQIRSDETTLPTAAPVGIGGDQGRRILETITPSMRFSPVAMAKVSGREWRLSECTSNYGQLAGWLGVLAC